MIFRHPNCHHHTYPKTERLRYSLTFSHNSYSYPLILLAPQLLFIPSYSSRTLPTCTCMCSTNHPGPFQPRRATHAHSAQDADPRRAEALRWLLRRLCHRLVRLPRQEQRHGRARYLGQEGVSSSPTPSLDSYKLLAHFTHMWPSANPVRTAATSPYTGAAGPLRGLGHQHSPHALPALRPGWRGGHAKSACRRVGAKHSARPHTPRPPRARSVCVAALASAPHPRAGGRHRVVPAVWALFQGLCSGTARRQAAPRSSHAVTPPPHTAHTLLFHNTKARTPPAPCS